MRITKNELFKLISSKALLVLAAILLCINGLSLLLDRSGTDTFYAVPDSAYRLLQSDLEKIPNDERLAFLTEKRYEQRVYEALSLSDRADDIVLDNPILSESAASAKQVHLRCSEP